MIPHYLRVCVSWYVIHLVLFSLCLCVSVVRSEAPFYPDKTQLLVVRDAGGKEQPVRTAADWAKRRTHILANMQLVMGPLPDDSDKVPLDVKVTEVVDLPHYVRKKLTFAVEKGDRVPAYLLIPKERKGKLPAVLVLHQTINIGKGEPAGLVRRRTSASASTSPSAATSLSVPTTPASASTSTISPRASFNRAA